MERYSLVTAAVAMAVSVWCVCMCECVTFGRCLCVSRWLRGVLDNVAALQRLRMEAKQM